MADAEVVIPDLNISVRTNVLGRFRVAGVAKGTHRVSARKVGYAATEMDVDFAGPAPVLRQFLLDGVVNLDPVAVRARAILPDFEEHRALGLGRFVTRDELAKKEGVFLSSVIRELSGVDVVNGRGTYSFVRSSRVPRVTGAPNFGLNRDNIYCPPHPSPEEDEGVTCNCYAQVYLDKMLLNPGRPTQAVDINTFAPFQIEAVEYYASIAELPMEYAKKEATCGVVVLHTRRSK
ncbi:MAG TPA: carboxypeptidase-like regulatory domain-containing protein [Gemmatimonadaceae bacterium]